MLQARPEKKKKKILRVSHAYLTKIIDLKLNELQLLHKNKENC